MLPEGWKRVPLHKIAEVRTGLAKGKQGMKEPVELPYLRVANVQDGHIDLTEVKTIALGKADIGRYALLAGDVLMTEGGDFDKLGRGAVWSGEITPCLHQNHVFAVRPAAKFVDSRFLAALSASEYGRNYFLGCAKRSTNLASINSSQLRAFPVLLPRLEEQKGISEVLAVWDAAIATTEKILTNSRNYWLGLICELLMPVPISTQRQAGSFPPSVQAGIPKLPPTPKGWRKVALGTHLHEISRPVSLDPDTEYTLVTVRRSRGGVDKRSVLPGSEIKTPTQFFVAAGDFLISKRQIVHGACGIVPAELDGAVVSNEYAVLGSDGEIDPRFLRYLSETTYFQQTCFHSSIGVHVEKMLFRTEQWLKRPFNIPPLDEQRRIIEILDAARQQISLAEQQLTLLKAEKRALMQQLLTGKRRVRLPASEAMEA